MQKKNETRESHTGRLPLKDRSASKHFPRFGTRKGLIEEHADGERLRNAVASLIRRCRQLATTKCATRDRGKRRTRRRVTNFQR